jgi:hypothetical protein
MKKIISLITFVLVMTLTTLCFAENNFEADTRSIYSDIKSTSTAFDIGVNYINFKEKYGKLYQNYITYKSSYEVSDNIKETPDIVMQKRIVSNESDCFDVYMAVHELWRYDVSSNTTVISKIDWIWNEFPNLSVLHRDWLGGYNTKKAIWIVLDYRKDKENALLDSINERFEK